MSKNLLFLIHWESNSPYLYRIRDDGIVVVGKSYYRSRTVIKQTGHCIQMFSVLSPFGDIQTYAKFRLCNNHQKRTNREDISHKGFNTKEKINKRKKEIRYNLNTPVFMRFNYASMTSSTYLCMRSLFCNKVILHLLCGSNIVTGSLIYHKVLSYT